MRRRIITAVSLILVVTMLAVVLVACVPKDINSAVDRMKGKGFEVKKLDIEGNQAIRFTKGDKDASITATAILFKDKNKLNAKYNSYNNSLTKSKNEFKKAKPNLLQELESAKKNNDEARIAEINLMLAEGELYTNSAVKKSGDWLIVGEKRAISAFF